MSPFRALVAEDNQVTSAVIARQLRKLGGDVTAALDGRAALDAAIATPFDLVFSDEQMPRMNGRAFCRALRELPAHGHTPVVFCTAKGFELDHELLKSELGVAAVLIKPFSPSALSDLAASLLEGTPAAG